jgi:hypothetical protein
MTTSPTILLKRRLTHARRSADPEYVAHRREYMRAWKAAHRHEPAFKAAKAKSERERRARRKNSLDNPTPDNNLQS